MAQAEAKPPIAKTGTGLSLKLLIDKNSNRVMFAEAGKDVIDFLFSLLQMPLGSIIRLLTAEATVGCIGNLYESVERIDDDYIQPDVHKEMILKPKIVSASLSQSASLLTIGGDNPSDQQPTKKYYSCYSQCTSQSVTDICGAACPRCNSTMVKELHYVRPNKGIAHVDTNKGYVKELVTYMVRDDLRMMPMSTISGLTLLKEFGVEDIGSLKEKTVVIGLEQGLELLKASFESKTVLTDIFLRDEKVSPLSIVMKEKASKLSCVMKEKVSPLSSVMKEKASKLIIKYWWN